MKDIVVCFFWSERSGNDRERTKWFCLTRQWVLMRTRINKVIQLHGHLERWKKKRTSIFIFYQSVITIHYHRKKKKNQTERKKKSFVFLFLQTKIKNQLECEQGQQGERGKRMEVGLLIVTCGIWRIRMYSLRNNRSERGSRSIDWRSSFVMCWFDGDFDTRSNTRDKRFPVLAKEFKLKKTKNSRWMKSIDYIIGWRSHLRHRFF